MRTRTGNVSICMSICIGSIGIALGWGAAPLVAQSDPPPPRRPIADAGRGIALFAQDLWSVVRSPADATPRGWWLTAGVFTIGGALFAYDEEIMNGVQRNRDNAFLRETDDAGAFIEPIGLMGRTNIYYIGGIGLGYLFRWERLQRISTDLLFTQLIGGLTRDVGNIALGRRRPFEDKGAYDFEFNGGTSFPSGHTTTAFGVATVLSAHTDWWPASLAYYGLATTIAYQRVHAQGHWPSDVWLAAWWGYHIGRIVVAEHNRKNIIWVPHAARGGGGLSLRYAY